MRYTLELEISPSSKLATLTCNIGKYIAVNRTVAEILIHGPLEQCIINALEDKEKRAGRPNIFRGELYQLAGYEILDTQTESIIEKDYSINQEEKK